MSRWIVAAIFLFFAVFSHICLSSVCAQTADELVQQGKQELFENRNPVNALNKFNAALQLDASHPQAHLWHAVTAVCSDPDLIQNLKDVNMLDNDNTLLILDAAGKLSYDFNRPYPDATALQTLAVNLLPEIDAAISDFDYIDTSFTDSFTLPQRDTIDLDYADAKVVAGILYLAKMTINVYASYDMDSADVQDTFWGAPDAGKSKFETFLSDYADAFKLLTGHAAKLAGAKTSLLNALSCYFTISDYIRNHRLENDGLNHLIQFYDPYDADKFASYQEWEQEKEEYLYREEYIRNKLVELDNQLIDPATYPVFSIIEDDFIFVEESPEPVSVNVDTFFTDPQDARSYLDEVDQRILFDDFSDPTIGGLLPYFTTADWNYTFRYNAIRIDTTTVQWDAEVPNGVKLWLEWYDKQPHARFVQYKIFRATTIDVDDSATLIATVTDATQLTYIDDSIDSSQNVYYYRVYTYYDFGNGQTAMAKSDRGTVIFRVYVDAGNASDPNQDGTQAHPYSNLAKTFDDDLYRISHGTTLYIAGGTYRADHDFEFYIEYDGLTLKGGYEPVNWTRDIQANPTIIDGTAEYPNNIISLNHVFGVTIDGVTITNAQGGSMWINGCDSLKIINCTVTNNNIQWGQAISVARSKNVIIKDCVVSDNFYQGIMFNENSSGSIINTRVENNRYEGMQIENSSDVEIKNCQIKNNEYSGIFIKFTQNMNNTKIVGNLIANNGSTGILFSSDGTSATLTNASVINNTIVNNDSTGVYIYNQTVAIINNIIAANNRGIYGNISINTGLIHHNNVYDNYENFHNCGTGAGQDNNISADPMFYNDSAFNPAYWLTTGSPCIDEGDNDAYPSSALDIDGYNRFSDYSIDMGAYEYSDTDNDGMNNRWEDANSLDASADDTSLDFDNDGLSNIEEYTYKTKADNPDTDNDGLSDSAEIEIIGTNPNTSDTDDDGLTDLFEISYDNDGSSYNSSTDLNPFKADTDNDRLPDEWEVENGTNPLMDDADNDNDNDGMSNGNEYGRNTDPLNADTDNDGLNDGEEMLLIDLEFQVNTHTLNHQESPSVASNGTTYLITWESSFQDGSWEGIYGRLYKNDTNTIGPEFRVNAYTPNDQYNPSVASNGTTYLVTWESRTQSGRIYGQLYDSEGDAIGPEFQVSSYTTSWQDHPSVASNGTTYFVIWRREDTQISNGYHIYGQLYDNDGNTIGPEFLISAYKGFPLSTSPIVASNGITYLVAWPDFSGIYGQLYDNDGHAIGPEFQVTSWHDNDNLSVASNGITYLITWEAYGDGWDKGIYGQLYDNGGHAIRPEFQVNTYTSHHQESPSVASNGTTYLVTWDSSYQDGWGKGIYGQFFDNDGNKIGLEFQINKYTTDDQGLPSITSNGTTYLVAWVSWYQDGSQRGVYGQFVNSTFGTNPLNPDSDDDGLKDGEEVTIYNSNPVNDDTDEDGLLDGYEIYSYNTSPTNPDTDNDGMNDGDEVYAGMAPDNPESLFRVLYCGYNQATAAALLQWQGSVYDNMPYTIFWNDDLVAPWKEAIIYPDDIMNSDGIRTWIDNGDEQSIPPRPAPDNATSRYYKVIVE